MASGKSTAKKIEDADLGAAVDQVEGKSRVPDRLKQKVVPGAPNSTFAQRAKARNKRVDASDASSK